MSKTKFIILIVLILSILAIVLLATFIFTRYLPYGCNGLYFGTACVEFYNENDTNIDMPKSGLLSGTFCTEDDYSCGIRISKTYLRKIMFSIKTLKCVETNDRLSDAQVLKFSFLKDNEILEEYFVAYDFYLKKTYILKDEVWYKIETSTKFDDMITTLIDATSYCSLDLVWRGQSTYAKEEFVKTDWSNASFRYNIKWRPTENSTVRREKQYKNSDFNNVDKQAIVTKEEAISRAAKELNFSLYKGVAFFDETCGYWLVEIYEDYQYNINNYLDFTDFLHENVYTVVVDDCGRTIETYQNVTRFVPFLNNTE